MSTWDDKPNDYEHALQIIERLRDDLAQIERIANIPATDDAYGSLVSRMHKVWLLARGHQQGTIPK